MAVRFDMQLSTNMSGSTDALWEGVVEKLAKHDRAPVIPFRPVVRKVSRRVEDEFSCSVPFTSIHRANRDGFPCVQCGCESLHSFADICFFSRAYS